MKEEYCFTEILCALRSELLDYQERLNLLKKYTKNESEYIKDYYFIIDNKSLILKTIPNIFNTNIETTFNVLKKDSEYIIDGLDSIKVIDKEGFNNYIDKMTSFNELIKYKSFYICNNVLIETNENIISIITKIQESEFQCIFNLNNNSIKIYKIENDKKIYLTPLSLQMLLNSAIVVSDKRLLNRLKKYPLDKDVVLEERALLEDYTFNIEENGKRLKLWR